MLSAATSLAMKFHGAEFTAKHRVLPQFLVSLPCDEVLYFFAMRKNTETKSVIYVMLSLFLLSPGITEAQSGGEQLFLNNCAECHQRDGKGIPNIYPALAGSEVVRGSGVDVALVLIIGRGEMPSFAGALSHEDMASIINYVRNAWGNSGDPISAETVESLQ